MAIITPVVREESVEAIYLSAGKTLLLPQFAPNPEQEICLIKGLKIYLDETSSVCVSERERARSPQKKTGRRPKTLSFPQNAPRRGSEYKQAAVQHRLHLCFHSETILNISWLSPRPKSGNESVQGHLVYVPGYCFVRE